MAVATRTRALQRRFIADFSGGLNIRDAPGEVADNESPALLNVTMDERGGVVQRRGFKKDNTGSIANATPWNLFYSEALDQLILQVGTKVFKRTAVGSYTEITRAGPLAAFTTSKLAGFADLNGNLYAVHPDDGVLKYTGAGSLTSVNTTVKGNAMVTWQNKLFATGLTNTVWWSNAGNGDTWTTASDFVQVRDVNDDICTAIGFGQALDHGAIPASGLLVFKRGSTHRITDSATGAYTTLSAEAGAAGSRAVAHLNGITCFANDKGVWITDGEATPQPVSGKIGPLFRSNAIDLSKLSNMAMGIYRDRVLLSLTRMGASANDITFEYNPAQGWFVPHSFGFAAYGLLRGSDSATLALSSASDPNLVTVFTGGADNVNADGTGGSAITCRFQTRWFQPVEGGLVRARRVRVQHRGGFNFYLHRDFVAAAILAGIATDDQDVGGIWGTGLWGTMIWGPATPTIERFTDFYSLGVAKAISFEFQQTGRGSAVMGRLLGDGVTVEQGECALYELHLDYVSLGFA